MTTATTLPRLKMCKNCSDIAVAWDGRCIRHTRASRSTRGYTERPMPTPAMKNPFGMELECINPDGNRHALNVVSKFPCSDASLGDGGVEIKIVADAKKIGDKAADIAQRARMVGGVINHKCGFHVHMSRPVEYKTLRGVQMYQNIGGSEASNLYPYLRGMEATFMSMVPKHRRDNQYCRALSNANDIFDHYYWLSISTRVPTIELRIHPGTLNPWKVKAWAEVCAGLQTILHSIIAGKPNEAAEKAKEGNLLSTFEPNSLAAKYIKARLNANGNLKKFGF
jgi:hypothetical protein